MSKLDSEQFARVEALYFEAAALPAEAQSRYVEEHCAGDALVRDEVLEMLRHAHKADSIAPLARNTPGVESADQNDVNLLIGSRIDGYEVKAILGQGGMGVVYRAHDSRLERPVAIKSIPIGLEWDESRMARFLREAKILASLSHPNIATVYELAHRDKERYLVMELIDGVTLAQKLAEGPMRIEEALQTCAQIAAGLAAAHEAGVIHRDLKPHNVMLCAENQIKVLDFGLARDVRIPTDSQTTLRLDQAGTRPGAVLGTPGYMSPEQLRGQVMDRRTDVFALGCILYECLTGNLAFPGETGADRAARVLDSEPNWSLLPRATPQPIQRLLRRCLTKDISRRLRDMADLRLELEDALTARDWLSSTADQPVQPKIAARRTPWIIAALALLAAGVFAILALLHKSQPPAKPTADLPPIRRFAVRFPGDKPQNDLPRVRMAVSRDGSRIVLSASSAAQETPQLWIRGRDDYDFRALAGTSDAFMPSFSPDGNWIIYHEDRTMMKKSLSGGNPVPVTEVGGFWGTFCWGSDGMITYVPVWGRGLVRIPVQGGASKTITTVDYDRKEFAHIGPCVTPDNKTAIFTVWNGAEDCRIEGVDIATGKRYYKIVEHGTSPRIAKTPAGYALLYEHNGNLFALPFDVENIRATGPEIHVVDGVMTDNVLFSSSYDVADDGTLVYIPGPPFVEESRLCWVDEEKRLTPFNDDRYAFGEPRFCSDGSKISMIVKGKTYRVYVYDMASGRFDAVVTDGDVVSAAMSPNGQMLVYSCNKDGPYALWIKRLADGTSEKLFDGAPTYQTQLAWSPDSRYIAFSMASGVDASRDIHYVDLQSTRQPTVFANAAAEERASRFSPNGKWMVYTSNQSGTREIFIKNFPLGAMTRQLTLGGGDWPEWSPDGKTLYYRKKGVLHAMPMNPQDGTPAGKSSVIYEKPFGQNDFELPDYTLDPKGRLLIVEPSERGPSVKQMNVVQNWWRVMEGQAAGK